MRSGEGPSLEIPIKMEPRGIIKKIFGKYLKTAYLWTKYLLIKEEFDVYKDSSKKFKKK